MFNEFFALSDEATSELASALEQAPLTLSGIARALHGHVSNDTLATETLLSFTSWRSSNGLSLDEALDRLRDEFPEAEINGGATRVLAAEAIVVLAKTMDLQFAHERVFQRVRIISDIRPVFGDESDPTPIAASVSHELVLTVFRNQNHEEVHVALDSEDLEALMQHAERALAKDAELSALIRKTGLRGVDWGEVTE